MPLSASDEMGNHVCLICKKVFNNPSRLRQHLPVHTKEKKYECHMCGNRFTQSSNLYRHVKSQTCQKNTLLS